MFETKNSEWYSHWNDSLLDHEQYEGRSQVCLDHHCTTKSSLWLFLPDYAQKLYQTRILWSQVTEIQIELIKPAPKENNSYNWSIGLLLSLCSVVSNPLWPHGLQPTRFLFPWNFSGKILGWVTISSFRGSSWPRDSTQVSCVSCIGRWILYYQHYPRSPLFALGTAEPRSSNNAAAHIPLPFLFFFVFFFSHLASFSGHLSYHLVIKLPPFVSLGLPHSYCNSRKKRKKHKPLSPNIHTWSPKRHWPISAQ